MNEVSEYQMVCCHLAVFITILFAITTFKNKACVCFFSRLPRDKN